MDGRAKRLQNQKPQLRIQGQQTLFRSYRASNGLRVNGNSQTSSHDRSRAVQFAASAPLSILGLMEQNDEGTDC
jgi:hypothetical protein